MPLSRYHVGTVAVGGDTYGRIAEVVGERRGATSGPVGQELREDRRQSVDIRLQTFELAGALNQPRFKTGSGSQAPKKAHF